MYSMVSQKYLLIFVGNDKLFYCPTMYYYYFINILLWLQTAHTNTDTVHVTVYYITMNVTHYCSSTTSLIGHSV